VIAGTGDRQLTLIEALFFKWHLMMSLVLALSLFSQESFSFSQTEDELFDSAVREAKSRAQDFKAHLRRAKQEAEEREIEVGEIRRQRIRDQEIAERDRIEYVKTRVSYDQIVQGQEQLERQWEKIRLKDDQVMDVARRDYLKKRARVQQLIEREAFIDENAEYDITKPPVNKTSDTSQSQSKSAADPFSEFE
jgi:hypothetical protein